MPHPYSNLPVFMKKLSRASLRELAGLFPQFRHWRDWLGHPQRNRHFPPWVAFWMFLHQALNPGCSCSRTLIKAAGWISSLSRKRISTSTSGYCQARGRLALNRLQTVFAGIHAWLEQQVPSEQLWHDRRVRIVDGSMISLADTQANQKKYPQQKSQKKGCGFPALRLVVIFSLASGALIDYATSSFYVAERVLFRTLSQVLGRGEILLADRGFCSFFDIAWLQKQGVDSVIRLNEIRSVNSYKVKRLGKNDCLVRWTRPAKRSLVVPARHWQKLPAEILLRQVTYQVSIKGMRTRKVTVVTTLLDPLAYPAGDFANLYLRRWQAELFLHEIKQILQMETLSCRTPAMVQKQLCMHLIAYNLIRCLIWEAAMKAKVPPERISFKASLAFTLEWAPLLLAAAKQPSLYKRLRNSLLSYLAACLVPSRPGRREPRAIKRRPKSFQLLSAPRKSFRETPHRGKLPYVKRS
jgi:hypothetical protein